MPPPHLPPSERADSVVPPAPRARRHIGKLFWVGVAIAPIAALLLVIGNGVGPLRAAAALAILSVVIIGLSVVLRDDAAMVKDDVEDQLRTEVDRLRADIDSLRRGVEISVHRELERVHHELEATRRESVIRAEAGRMNPNRLTAGELPAAEEEYLGERQRRGHPSGGRGRSERPVRAITARGTDAKAAAPGEPGYDWFGNPESAPGVERHDPREPAAAGRGEQAAYGEAGRGEAGRGEAGRGEAGRGEGGRGEGGRYEAGAYAATTYGTARPSADPADAAYAQDGRRPQRGADGSSSDAGSDGRGRRSRSGNIYGGADQVASGVAKPAGTEYGSSSSRRGGPPEGTAYQATTYGSSAAAPEQPDDGRRRQERRWVDEDPAAYEAPNNHLIDYDDAPPVYGGNRAEDGAYRGADEGGYRGSRAAQNSVDEGSELEDPSGTVDYSEFWSRSASPPRPDAAPRSSGEQDAGPEWSSWRETGPEWETGQQRYNRDDPQVITGAITGAILDIPYTVGGQALSEPGFGAGNGFGAGSGFGAGNGFAAGEPRWDEPPSEGGWPGAPASPAPGADQGSAPEFELPSLDHLPRAGGPESGGPESGGPESSGPRPAAAGPEAGGRHARHASATPPDDQPERGRYRSW
jgi:hypothetical protein